MALIECVANVNEGRRPPEAASDPLPSAVGQSRSGAMPRLRIFL